MRWTLEECITAALQMANLPADTTTRIDAIVSAAEIARVLNWGLSRLHAEVLRKRRNHFEVTERISLSSGVDFSLLPDTYLALRGGIWLLDSGSRARLLPWDITLLDGTTTTDTSSRPKYRIQGKAIRWLPAPSSSFSAEVIFLRSFRRLLNLKDELDPLVEEGWEQFPISEAASYCLKKQGLDPSGAEATKAEVLAIIRDLASDPEGEGECAVTDVYQRDASSGRPKLPYPRIP